MSLPPSEPGVFRWVLESKQVLMLVSPAFNWLSYVYSPGTAWVVKVEHGHIPEHCLSVRKHCVWRFVIIYCTSHEEGSTIVHTSCLVAESRNSSWAGTFQLYFPFTVHCIFTDWKTGKEEFWRELRNSYIFQQNRSGWHWIWQPYLKWRAFSLFKNYCCFILSEWRLSECLVSCIYMYPVCA